MRRQSTQARSWPSCCWPTRPIPMRRTTTARRRFTLRSGMASGSWSNCCWPTKPIPMSETTPAKRRWTWRRASATTRATALPFLLPGRHFQAPVPPLRHPAPPAARHRSRSLKRWLTCCAGTARWMTCLSSTGLGSGAASTGYLGTMSLTKGTKDWSQFTALGADCRAIRVPGGFAELGREGWLLSECLLQRCLQPILPFAFSRPGAPAHSPARSRSEELAGAGR